MTPNKLGLNLHQATISAVVLHFTGKLLESLSKPISASNWRIDSCRNKHPSRESVLPQKRSYPRCYLPEPPKPHRARTS